MLRHSRIFSRLFISSPPLFALLRTSRVHRMPPVVDGSNTKSKHEQFGGDIPASIPAATDASGTNTAFGRQPGGSSSSAMSSGPGAGRPVPFEKEDAMPLPNDFLQSKDNNQQKQQQKQQEDQHQKSSSSDSLPLPSYPPEPQQPGGRGKKSMDSILRDVMNDALSARDRGEHPDMDYIYKNAQERIYEEEHGEPPPTKRSNHRQHIPFPPRDDVRRITPLTLFDNDQWPLRPGEQRFEALDEKGQMTFAPERSAQDDDEEESSADGAATAAAPPPPAAAAAEKLSVEDAFLDCSDELAHWEKVYIDFIRDFPVALRRALPLYTEQYKLLTHRLARAERRYVKARDAVVTAGLASPTFFAATEKRVERVRKIYTETHKSLTQNYDPMRMRKSFTGVLLKMSAEEYEEWLDKDRDERNCDFANMQV